ncbi:MAG: hypothetical protein QW520_04800 [Methanomassiliicoccales archaeon]
MRKAIATFIAISFLLTALAGIFLGEQVRGGSSNYGEVTVSGGFQKNHFDEIWDLTKGDIVISFTYDARGMVDDVGGSAHAWAQLGMRSVGSDDFNPSGAVYATKTVDLMAGKYLDVGQVEVWRVNDRLYIRFVVDAEGWYMTETHAAVADSMKGIPQTKTGNPIPGKFPMGMCHVPPVTEKLYCYELQGKLKDPTKDLYVAAHAELIHVSEYCMQIVSDANTEWSGDNSTWYPAVHCWAHPSWPTIPGAYWIWRTELTDPGEEYNTVPEGGWWFREKFTLPSNAFDIQASLLSSNADNAYVIGINGVVLGGDGNMNKDGPDHQEWSTVEQFPVPAGIIVPGGNELQLRALNYFSWGDAYSNPAGLIYKLSVCYKVIDRCESAWANGYQFPGANWAMYFTYKAGTPILEGAGVWLATDYDWSANTFDPDPVGMPSLDLDDKLILQRRGGAGEGDYNLPYVPPVPWSNHRVWWDRDGVDPWQSDDTANTGGIYQIEIFLHATSDITGEAYMRINGKWQGFETDGNWNTIELSPAGMTFVADMHALQVFYGIFGYGATHSATFSNITVTQM